MKKTKVFLSALLMAAVFSFTACSNPSSGSGNSGGDSTPASPAEPTYSVTIEASTNGTVTASKTSGIAAGETITLTVTPAVTEDTDYKLRTLSVKNGSADVTVTNNTFTMPSGNVIVTATFEAIVYYGTKKPSKAKEVGDIVFNDGSATPYSAFTTENPITDAQKVAAIAIIFYKGTDLNSDVYGEDGDGNVVWTSGSTTTSRTLGVGLKHYRINPGIAWCTNDAKAYKKDISTIQCITSGNAGALEFEGDKNGSDNLEQIKNVNGVDDTSSSTKYPAFYFAKNYKEEKIGSETVSRILSGSEYESGWYLPSIAELFQIWACRSSTQNTFDVDAVSELCGGNKFETEWYWSSSQWDFHEKDAYELCFDDGDWSANVKDTQLYVCCIREFN